MVFKIFFKISVIKYLLEKKLRDMDFVLMVK